MAISFEKWLEIQLKTKGRAAIDSEMIIKHFWNDPPLLWNFELKELKINWPEWKKLAEDHYNQLPEDIRARDNEQSKFFYLHSWLSEVFISETAVISAYFREYYGMFGIYDRKYFKRLVNDFRRHFPPDTRHPRITYFDNLIGEFTAEYGSGELVKPPLKFADFLNHDNPEHLIIKLKQEFPTGINKEAALMITALESAGLLNEIENETDLISAIKKEWNTNFEYESYMKPRRQFRKRREVEKKEDTVELKKAIKYVSGCI